MLKLLFCDRRVVDLRGENDLRAALQVEGELGCPTGSRKEHPSSRAGDEEADDNGKPNKVAHGVTNLRTAGHEKSRSLSLRAERRSLVPAYLLEPEAGFRVPADVDLEAGFDFAAGF